MNTNKFNGFFDPDIIKDPIHIIGCGAIGSTLAVMLARCGVTNIVLWDHDNITSHNIANQQFTHDDIGEYKAKVLASQIHAINPNAKVMTFWRKWDGDKINGYVFMAVDSIEVRQQIVKTHRYSPHIKAMFDFRMRLKDAQHFAADWTDANHINMLASSMDFTSEEAKANTDVNACNMEMSIMPTVQTVVSYGVANFINYLHGEELEPLIMVNPFKY